MTKIASLHQIEITSRCNLRCKYCVHPTMTRAKLDMDRNTYRAALKWASHYVHEGTQKELNLAGIGESTLHPDFIEYVALAREAVGPSVNLCFATNGLLVNDAMAVSLVKYRPIIWVSLHRPERAANAVNILRKHGLLYGVSTDPSMASINWAGQLKWEVTAPKIHCPWLVAGRAFITADGRVISCCLDGRETSGGELHHDITGADLTKLHVKPYDLCTACNYFTPEVKQLMSMTSETTRQPVVEEVR
jgi:hypothetical protein